MHKHHLHPAPPANPNSSLPAPAQATFLPVVQLFEGAGMVLEALQGLRCSLTAARCSAGGQAPPLPPPLQRAMLRGEAVAGALQLLSQVRQYPAFLHRCMPAFHHVYVACGMPAVRSQHSRVMQLCLCPLSIVLAPRPCPLLSPLFALGPGRCLMLIASMTPPPTFHLSRWALLDSSVQYVWSRGLTVSHCPPSRFLTSDLTCLLTARPLACAPLACASWTHIDCHLAPLSLHRSAPSQ